MINKELIMMGGGELEWGEYTHLITVEHYTQPYGLPNIIGYAKDLPPQFPEDPYVDVGACQKFNDSSLSLKYCYYDQYDNLSIVYIEAPDDYDPNDPEAEAEPLYVGRSDTRTLIIPFSPTIYIYYDEIIPVSGQLFSEADVGKEIPIWISNTPPPLGMNRLIATYCVRLHDA